MFMIEIFRLEIWGFQVVILGCSELVGFHVLTGKKDTCSTMFIAALFIIARIWKEPRCPSTEEWIQKNVVHLYNGVLLSYYKR